MEGDHFKRLVSAKENHFNPLPPHGGRQSKKRIHRIGQEISIHSLRMEGDSCWRSDSLEQAISIHSLRMEGDKVPCICGKEEIIFQSTPSAWRETACGLTADIKCGNFNPLPPHGGRPLAVCLFLDCSPEFQSTPSAWRETMLFLFFMFFPPYFNPLPPHGGRPA